MINRLHSPLVQFRVVWNNQRLSCATGNPAQFHMATTLTGNDEPEYSKDHNNILAGERFELRYEPWQPTPDS